MKTDSAILFEILKEALEGGMESSIFRLVGEDIAQHGVRGLWSISDFISEENDYFIEAALSEIFGL